MQYKPENTDWFLENELAPPTTTSHGTDDDIRSHLKPVKTWGWTLSGNQLSCETDHGKLTQTIPPDYICLGDDSNGRPLLRKIEV